MRIAVWLSLCFLATTCAQDVQITVDATAGRRSISPGLYGKNNCLSDRPDRPLSAEQWQRLRDAGVRLVREGGGNNSTKYNWVLKLSSHPDWYNNVYEHDWDYAVTSLQAHLPGVQGMWSFQLIGRVAASRAANFNDWAYNRSQWWPGVRNNWAGGGGPQQGDGDPSLYLMPWGPDDTTAILDHWFDPNGLAVDPNVAAYWNMDNEPEIWSSTHDDVIKTQPSAESFMERFVEVALAARARFPGIRLVGPVPANEWQWYNWDNRAVPDGEGQTVWLEYFIKQIAAAQRRTGVRLLDVLDVHFYPGESDPADIVQLHRVWFDWNYEYPGANGVKRLGRWGWDDSIRTEAIFARCRQWLEQALGPDHGVGLGVTEIGLPGDDPDVTAVAYASLLAVFTNEGVELLTPWTWKVGMWEVLHLFTSCQRDLRVAAQSSDELTVSAVGSIGADQNDLTVILINRDLSRSHVTEIRWSGFTATDPVCAVRQLRDLPDQETFVSARRNALRHETAVCAGNRLELSLPPLSVTAVLVRGWADDPEGPRRR